jgi:uncharacterized protein
MANADIVRGAYDAFAKGDIPAVLGVMTPDIVWTEAENFPYADHNPYVGPDAILQGVFARLGGEWEGFAVALEELIDAGDVIVALGRYRGLYKATGKSIDAQFAHIWRFKDRKVTRFDERTDTLQATRAVSG